MESTFWWLIAGAVLIALEVFTVPGIGFLFAGLAAIIVAVLVKMDVVALDAYIGQFAWFFGLTIAWAAALWIPIKQWRVSHKSGEYHNMIGTSAIVTGDGLKKGKQGQVMWSGAVMNAELLPDVSVADLAPGTTVEIVKVSGNTLIVKPR